MENTIRVLIADEDKEFCAMLRETFCIDERMEIIGTYGDGNGSGFAGGGRSDRFA